MYARKKTGPRPIPLRDLDVRRPLSQANLNPRAAGLSAAALLVLAATTAIGCGGAANGEDAEVPTVAPTECPRLGGAVQATPLPVATAPASASPSASPSSAPNTTNVKAIQPNPDPPPLAGDVAPSREELQTPKK